MPQVFSQRAWKRAWGNGQRYWWRRRAVFIKEYLYEEYVYFWGTIELGLQTRATGNGGFYSEKVKFSADGYESSEVQVPEMEIEMYWSCDKNLTGLSEEERYLSTTVHIKVKAIYREYEYSYESNYSLIKKWWRES